MTDYAADLKLAYETLKAKSSRLETYYRYYDGDHPSFYASSKLTKVFKTIDLHFSENWCAAVVDILLDRLNLGGFRVPAALQETVNTLWSEERLGVQADEAHADVAIAGESYFIVWPDESGRVRLFKNSPQMCHVWYAASDPSLPVFAAKWWTDADAAARMHVSLYYPDEFAHFVSQGKGANVSAASAFVMDGEPELNEQGVVPVFPLRTRERRPYGELQNALTIQKAINRLADDMMVASEYSAFKQRWAITNANPADMKASPGTTLAIPPANTADGEQPVTVGEFAATELQNYIGAIEHKANAMASITRTPKQAFIQPDGRISGDALVAMEAQVAKKAQTYQERLEVGWRDIIAFALQLSGKPVAAKDISASWTEERTVQPLSEAQSLQALVAAGMPLKTALRYQGWQEADLARMDADRAAQETTAATPAALALAAARKLNAGAA